MDPTTEEFPGIKQSDIEALDLKQLRALADHAVNLIEERQEATKAEAREKIEAMIEERDREALEIAKEAGLDQEEVMAILGQGGGKTPKRRRKPTAQRPPRYRHPTNPSITWPGPPGRPTAWMSAYQNAGGEREDLALDKFETAGYQPPSLEAYRRAMEQ